MTGTIFLIFLGSSQLLYTCARKAREYYGQDAEIQVIDTAYTPMKRKYIQEFGEVGQFKTKQEIFGYLESLQRPAYLLSVNNPYLIPKPICEDKRLTMINLHHALLPLHPGRNAEAWTIFEQDEYGGITWHYISSGVDTGDIICQEKVAVTEDMTSLKLLKACEKLAEESFVRLLPFEGLDRNAAKRQEPSGILPKKAKEAPNGGYADLSWGIGKCIAFLHAMDYGAANVFEKPKVEANGTSYQIISYKTGTGDTIQKPYSIEQTGEGSALLRMEGEGKSLVMKLVLQS